MLLYLLQKKIVLAEVRTRRTPIGTAMPTATFVVVLWLLEEGVTVTLALSLVLPILFVASVVKGATVEPLERS